MADIIDYEPAAHDDHWFHITQLSMDRIKANGTVHERILRDMSDLRPDRPWNYEISGRARFKAGTVDDIMAFARAAAANLKHAAAGPRKVLHVTVTAVRALLHPSDIQVHPWDVLYEPTLADSAHALIVLTDVPVADPTDPQMKPSAEVFRKLAKEVKAFDFEGLPTSILR